MRDLSSLERFCMHLIRSGTRLDGIVNNACQTIRRPAAYYAPLVSLELDATRWSTGVQALLADHVECFGTPRPPPLPPPPTPPTLSPPTSPTLPPPSAAITTADCDDRDAAGTAGVAESLSTAAAGAATADAATADAATADAATAAAGVTALWAAAPPSSARDGASSAPSVPSAMWSQAPLWSAEPGVAQPDEGSAEQVRAKRRRPGCEALLPIAKLRRLQSAALIAKRCADCDRLPPKPKGHDRAACASP